MLTNQIRALARQATRTDSRSINVRSFTSTAGSRTRSVSSKTRSIRHLATKSSTASAKSASSASADSIVTTPPTGSAITLKSATRDESQFGTRPIYLDVQATTPTDPRVLDKMLTFLTGMYGNPHSSTHAYGWETDKEVEKARVPRFYKKTKKHIITTQTEHKCVLDSARHMQDEGFDVTYLPVDEHGLISLDDLKAAIRKDTILVSVMAVNNEIGVVQPLKEIGKICRENKIFFHTDAAQAYGKIDIDVNDMNIDLLSISSHKIYGPMGIGACYVRRRPRVRLDPIITGGGQERGLRSGTLSPPLVAGFGEAARLMKEEMDYDKAHITRLSNKLKEGLLSIPATQLNGSNNPESQYPGCVNISFAYIEGESLLMALKDIALSSGSACTSASLEPSYVLHALGADDALAHSSIRFGIGRFTTEEEVDYVIKAINERVEFLRKMSPLWEMVQEGIDLDSIEWSGH
ncbi:hypothetical protein G9P44_006307 [Scheffersomyces stipitis]|nr:hypothetical protein G9P44_006307 [Scheffersomyces stipitis]